MKYKFFASAAIIIVVLACYAFVACDYEGRDDENAEDITGTPQPNGPSNHPPELISVSVIVNGEEVAEPATVLTTDEVEIAMEYADADCNISKTVEVAKSRITIKPSAYEPQGFEIHNSLGTYGYKIESIGCSSEEEGHPYYQSIDPLDYILPEGVVRTLPWLFGYDDACGLQSDPKYLPLDFTVVEDYNNE